VGDRPRPKSLQQLALGSSPRGASVASRWRSPPGRTHVFRKSLSCKDLQSSARNSTSRKFFADKDL
jgi:hypothetical protein